METSSNRLVALLVLLGLVLASVPAAARQAKPDDELITEFKRYYHKYKDTATRVEAVASLEGTESPDVVDVLVPLFDQAELEVGLEATRVMAKFKTRPPVDRIVAVLATATSAPVKIGLL